MQRQQSPAFGGQALTFVQRNTAAGRRRPPGAAWGLAGCRTSAPAATPTGRHSAAGGGQLQPGRWCTGSCLLSSGPRQAGCHPKLTPRGGMTAKNQSKPVYWRAHRQGQACTRPARMLQARRAPPVRLGRGKTRRPSPWLRSHRSFQSVGQRVCCPNGCTGNSLSGMAGDSRPENAPGVRPLWLDCSVHRGHGRNGLHQGKKGKLVGQGTDGAQGQP